MSKSKANKGKIEIPEENLCKDCPKEIRGKCCYISGGFDNNYHIILTNHPCKYLDTKTGRCKVYNKRRSHFKNCLSVEEMIICGTVPKECLYVKDNEEYQNRDDTRLIEVPKDLPKEIKKKYDKLNEYDFPDRYKYAECIICPECKTQDISRHYDEDKDCWWYECHYCDIAFARVRDQIKLNRKNNNSEKNGKLVKTLRKIKTWDSFLEVSD